MQNKTLFSDNYLQTRLHLQPEWAEDIMPVFCEMRKLYQSAQRFGNTWSEAQTEDEFIKKVLNLLGWSYIVQPKAQNRGKITRPDYALFANDEIKGEAQPFIGQDDAFYSRTLVIAEAKYWGRTLSQRDNSGREDWKTGNNPSHQMVSYLVGTKTPWGILTNGQTWRLYSREVSSTASEYYEIDLGLIFDFLPESGEPSPDQVNSFRNWWLFFRRDAFITGTRSKSFIQLAQEESTNYAREISEKLKKIVFQEVMPQIAGGFIKYRKYKNGMQQETPESLNEIYIASLSLLYKLLFLLYAEARSLLPMDNPDYRVNSLLKIAQGAALQIDQKRNISDSVIATPYYEALLALFRRIDIGEPTLGIPHYNGGLFNPNAKENQFLEQNKLSDKAIALVIDCLVRDQGETVDYAYISVRNLGAIYEGLLENKLNIINAATGQVVLINDKGERKATGSYYTPDYVVEYIVKNTLDPILETRNVDFEKAMGRISELHQKLEKTVDPVANRFYQKELGEAENQAREAFLGIKVLDPAMGSGHFLVNAVDHLTDGVIQRIQTYHDTHPEALPEWDPIQQMIVKVRRGILEEMAKQGLMIDSRRLDDTALLTRLVMKRCIYGVDLNPMAVELAKVSLWLHSFTIGAPLSFLDHHLRCGNSLIGTDVRTTEKSMASTKKEKAINPTFIKQAQRRGETARETAVAYQSNMFSGPFAGLLDLTSIMIEVADRADATLADVQQSAEDYSCFQHSLTPFKQILDLWVSQYFGNSGAKELLTVFGNDLLPILKGEKTVAEQYQLVIDNAIQLQHEKKFFHWDLEFPEVFVDLQKRDWAENGGFDAIIGNPPYVSAPSMVKEMPEERSFLSASQELYLVMKWDLYCAFLLKGWQLLSKNNYLGYIIPNQFFYQDYAQKLRHLFATESTINSIVDLGNSMVFDQAVVMTCIICISKMQPNPQTKTLTFITKDKQLSSLIDIDYSPIFQRIFVESPNNTFRLSILVPELEIINRITTHSLELQDLCYGSVGVVPHSEKLNKPKEEFIYLERKNNKCKKYIEGKNAGRYFIKWSGEWLEYDYHVVRRPSLPELLESPKIALKIVAGKTGLNACYDAEGIYTDHSFVLFTLISNLSDVKTRKLVFDVEKIKIASKYDLLFILSLINSRLLNWYYTKYLSSDLNIGPDDAKKLPIIEIVFTTTIEIREELSNLAKLMYETNDFRGCLEFAKSNVKLRNDLVHDQLSFLAKTMNDLNTVCQNEINGFLSWLSREIGVPIEEINGKTIIQNYLGDYQQGEEAVSLSLILDVLRKNQRQLKVNISSRAFQEQLSSEYQTSLSKLIPIKEKLASTDRLIDLIVYALYDLTDEAIAIVEGT